MSAQVWFDQPRERFWRVPEGVEIPSGTTVIRSLTGGRTQADVDALADWALPREQARRAVMDELRHATQHASRALGAAAQDVWSQASAQLPQDLTWAEMEARLGPMYTWAEQVRARAEQIRVQETVASGREQVERTAKQAKETLQRAGRVAGSAVRSARAVGRVVLDNPELAERASRWAEVLANSNKSDDRKKR